MFRRTLCRLGFAVLAVGVTMILAPAHSRAGGGSKVDTIKVNKCEYAVTGGGYVELLVSASSSNANAYLFAYLSDGTLLGQVQNGFGGKYGGTVLGSMFVPDSITIVSSYGGYITVPCVPFQP
jgi:hypothetical protein